MISDQLFMAECAKRGVKPIRPGSVPVSNMFTNGFTFQVAAGGTQTFNVNLSGDVSELLGLVVIGGLEADIATLKINNEIILMDTSLAALNPVINIYKDAQYFKMPRKLRGRDTVTLTVSGSAAHAIRPIFYCLPK